MSDACASRRQWRSSLRNPVERAELNAERYLLTKAQSLASFFRAYYGPRTWRRDLRRYSGRGRLPSWLAQSAGHLPKKLAELVYFESLALQLGYHPAKLEVAPALERNPRKLLSANELCRRSLQLVLFGGSKSDAYLAAQGMDSLSKHSQPGRQNLSDVLLLEAVVLTNIVEGTTRSASAIGHTVYTLPPAQRPLAKSKEVVRHPVTVPMQLVKHQDFNVCRVCAKPILEAAGYPQQEACHPPGGRIAPSISLSDARGTLEAYRAAALDKHPTDLALANRLASRVARNLIARSSKISKSATTRAIKASLRAFVAASGIPPSSKQHHLCRLRSFINTLLVQFELPKAEHKEVDKPLFSDTLPA